MTKKDLFAGSFIGFLIALLFIALSKNFQEEINQLLTKLNFSLTPWFLYSLLVVLPVIILVGLKVVELVAKKIKFLWQFTKCVVVGVLNTFIDLGVLNFLLWISQANVKTGWIYAIFKTISFSCASFNSYIWNKWWTFEKGSQLKGKEFAKFYILTGIGFLINVGIATLLVKYVSVGFVAEKVWAGIIAPLIAVLCGFVWNFTAYKFLVFKK